MIEGNLAWDIVGEIPWDDSPQFAFSRESAKYYEAFKSVVGELPESERSKVNFFSDTWNFQPYFRTPDRKTSVLNFKGLSGDMLRYCKFFCLHSMMGRTKLSTVSVRLTGFKGLFLGIAERTGHDTAMLLTTQDFIDEVEARNVGASTAHNLYIAAYQVMRFIKVNYRLNIGVDLDRLQELSVREKNIAKSQKEDSKLANIPKELYDETLRVSVACMRNETLQRDDRVMAATIVVLSQLGMRLGDVLALQTNALRPYQLGNGKRAGFIQYKSQKPSKAHQPMVELETFSDPLCTEAFETLLRLRKDCETAKGNRYLIVFDPNAHGQWQLPLPTGSFRNRYRNFFGKYLLNASRRDWDGIGRRRTYVPDPEHVQKTNALGRRGKPAAGHYERLSIPDTRQFRVHACTALYENGFSLAYIQRYMGHLSEYMLGYYVRPKDTRQESVSYSEDIVRKVAGEKLNLVGGAFPEQLTTAIRDFVASDPRDLATSISDIANDMGKTIAIRAKPGGVCIKADGVMGCSKDGRTDQILCLNGVCPNIYHLVPDIAVAYEDFKTMQETYRENLGNGFTRQAQQELSKLKKKSSAILLPELDELDRVIEERGEGWIVTRHPELIEAVASRDSIRKEVSEWMTKM